MTGVTKRVDRGRSHSYRLDGDKVDGVTTVIGDGIPKPALMPWAAREVATYAVDNLATIATLDRDAAIDLLKGSHFRERDRQARRGTEVHSYAAAIIDGTLEVQVPDELVAHVDSYLRFLDEFNVHPVLVETVVGNRTHRWMGTLDLVADLYDGLRWLLDIKTGRSGIFPETAVQLSAYKHAEFYLDPDGNEQPMPAVQQVGAVWVRADGYDLVPVDAGPDTYRVFRHAQRIAAWQNGNDHAIGDTIQPVKETA